MRWVYDEPKQDTPGFFAVLHSWDSYEGTWPESAQWTGTKWLWGRTSGIVAQAGPFDSLSSAKEWADKNDPGY